MGSLQLGPLQTLEFTQLFLGVFTVSNSRTVNFPEPPRMVPRIPGRWGPGRVHICFPRPTVTPAETKSTNEGKECEPSTWGAPTRRTFGSLGGHRVFNVCLQKLPKPEVQVRPRLPAFACKLADPRTGPNRFSVTSSQRGLRNVLRVLTWMEHRGH